MIDGEQTRGGETPERRIREIRTLRTTAMQDATRSGSATSEERLHIVNFDNDEGFALLSADRRLNEEIYAVAKGGNIDFDLLQRLIDRKTRNGTDGTRAVPIGDSARVFPPFYHGIADLVVIPKDSLGINPGLKPDTTDWRHGEGT